MKHEDESRKGSYLFGAIGLVLGLMFGFLFDALLEAVSGIAVRRGFSTDLRAALLKAFAGGVIGLVVGHFFGTFLYTRRDNDDVPDSADDRITHYPNNTYSGGTTLQPFLPSIGWANVLCHGIALILADRAIRPGSPLVPLPERVAFLMERPTAWTLAWVSWMLCAGLLIAFLALVRMCARDVVGRLLHAGLVVAVIGMIVDLSCDSVFIIALPRLAQAAVDSDFQTVERVTGFFSMTVANGAYSLAILLFTLALRRKPGIGAWTTAAGFGVAGFGFLLAAAGVTGVPWHAEWATPPTIVLFCIWCVLLARDLT